MRNPVIIPASREEYVINNNCNFKEGMKMSLVNMCMNIGYLDINIKIKRDEGKRIKRMNKNIEQDRRINEVLEKRKNIEIDYNLINYMG